MITRESFAVEKKDRRCAIWGRRINYLGHCELALNGREVATKLRDVKDLLWQSKARVAQLKRA